MSAVTFQSHSTYSTDMARAWRTDDVRQDVLKGAIQDSIESGREARTGEPLLSRIPSRLLITPDDKERTPPSSSSTSISASSSLSASESSSSSASASCSESSSTVPVPSHTLDLILSRLDTISNDIRDMRRINKIQNRQVENFVTMSCPDKLLSMVVCGYMKGVKDRNLTDADKQFLASERAREVQDDTRK